MNLDISLLYAESFKIKIKHQSIKKKCCFIHEDQTFCFSSYAQSFFFHSLSLSHTHILPLTHFSWYFNVRQMNFSFKMSLIHFSLFLPCDSTCKSTGKMEDKHSSSVSVASQTPNQYKSGVCLGHNRDVDWKCLGGWQPCEEGKVKTRRREVFSWNISTASV